MTSSIKITLGITGTLAVVTGILCLVYPGETILSLSWLIGVMVIASGISTLVFWNRAHFILPHSGSVICSGILQILLGILMLSHNLFVAVSIIYLFAGFLAFEGLNIAIYSFDFKHIGFRGWWVLFLIGVAACVLGVYSFVYPDVAGTTLSWLVGVAFILYGLFFFLQIKGIRRFERRFESLR